MLYRISRWKIYRVICYVIKSVCTHHHLQVIQVLNQFDFENARVRAARALIPCFKDNTQIARQIMGLLRFHSDRLALAEAFGKSFDDVMKV